MRKVDLTEGEKAKLAPLGMNLSEILVDQNLAKLGDAFVNFIYSLALSIRNGRGVNISVPSRILASALKRSGLKKLLPPRTSIHDQADAAEALSVYAWLSAKVTLEEFVSLLSQTKDDPTEIFRTVLEEIVKRLEPEIAKPETIQEHQA